MRLGRTGNVLDRKFGLRRIETPYRRHLTGFKVRINDRKSMCEAKRTVASANPRWIFPTTYSPDETQMTFRRLRNSPNMHENAKFKIGFFFLTFHTLQWIWSRNTNAPQKEAANPKRQLALTENNKRFGSRWSGCRILLMF